MLFQVMAKPSGASCNLRCTYCFYTEKEGLYDGPARKKMPLNVLESFIRQYIEIHDSQKVQFAWQGGEPTLLGVDFFQSVVSVQKKFAGDKTVSNTIQTNGILIDDEWCRFLKKNNFLVGLSVDGPRELNDTYRVKANQHPTFDAVMAGLELLKQHNIPFNTLTVINAKNSRHPLEVYRFLKKIGDGHMQFIPAVERMPDQTAKKMQLNLALPPSKGDIDRRSRPTPWSVSPHQLADFYTQIFNEWVHNDVGKVFVQFFDVALGNWLGAGAGLCHFSAKCGMAGALEHNGDLYSCDHYVYPQHKLGNIMETPLADLMNSQQQEIFGNFKLEGLPACCKICEVRPACHGDCPKHRFSKSDDGERGLSYLCKAYKKIFKHMAPYLKNMADLLRSERPASDVMAILRQQSMN